MQEITKDKILKGNIDIYQPKVGYRIGLDALLLASMLYCNQEAEVLDLGAGVGGISLSLLYRIPFIKVTSIENNNIYYELSLKNKQINSFVKNRYTPMFGDIKDFKNLYGKFDFVFSNPPYYQEASNNISPNELKRIASIEGKTKLSDFINCGYYYLKPKGSLYLIHKTSRLQDILSIAVSNKWGSIEVYPIYSFNKSDSDRVIIILKKLSKQKLVVKKSIIIHNDNGSYSKLIQSIVEEGKGYFEFKGEV